jgi:hypothetical protein
MGSIDERDPRIETPHALLLLHLARTHHLLLVLPWGMACWCPVLRTWRAPSMLPQRTSHAPCFHAVPQPCTHPHCPIHRHAAGSLPEMRPSVESTVDTRAAAPANDAGGNVARRVRASGWLRLTDTALLAAATCRSVLCLWSHMTLDCCFTTLAHVLVLYLVRAHFSLELHTCISAVLFAVCSLVPIFCDLAWSRLSTGAYILAPKPSVSLITQPGRALFFFMFMATYQVRWMR